MFTRRDVTVAAGFLRQSRAVPGKLGVFAPNLFGDKG